MKEDTKLPFVKTTEEKSRPFQCVCHGRNHILIADHFSWHSKGEIFNEEIMLGFKSTITSYEAHQYSGKNNVWQGFMNYLRGFRWRLTKAARILFLGRLETEDTWEPIGYEDDKLQGEQELQALIDWLQSALDRSRTNVKTWRKNAATR